MASGSTLRKVGRVIVGVGLIGLLNAPTADSGEPTELALLVISNPHIPQTVRVRAQRVAARIYRDIGVRLVWVAQGQPDVPYRFVLKISPAALPSVSQAALGLALGGTFAYAFYGRIQEFTDANHIDLEVVLGHVIAHEIGHLLLPQHYHSKTGLMSSSWTPEQAYGAGQRDLKFSADESRLIRTRLAEPVTLIAARTVSPQAER